jgi:hypothetical protein
MGINPDEQFVSELEQVSFQPVFILGVHRSGTSILYKMLVATGSFNPITAYHLIHYDELLVNHHLKKEASAKQHLTDVFTEKGLQDRGIDRLKLTADFAEEYGFLLNKRTVLMSLSSRNIGLFTQMCKKIQYIAGNDKPLLLKNPYDFPNFLYIKQMFPNARFVFIHRHPLKTISSTLNAIRTIVKKKNPYTTMLSKFYDTFSTNPLFLFPLRLIFCKIPEYGVLFISMITTRATRYYLKNIEKLPKEDYISITYEEFCMHPQETLEDIMKKLSPPQAHPIDAQSFIKPRMVDVDGSVQKFRNHIFRSMKTYCDTFHYSMGDE